LPLLFPQVSSFCFLKGFFLLTHMTVVHVK
jgi:hypothetical protein